MTPFALLAARAGLSRHEEAAAALGVATETAKSWALGRRRAPEHAVEALRMIIAKQEHAARAALAEIEAQRPELSYPADDAEARALGWPCLSAWKAMAARVIAGSPVPVRLVPRGTTAAAKIIHAGSNPEGAA